MGDTVRPVRLRGKFDFLNGSVGTVEALDVEESQAPSQAQPQAQPQRRYWVRFPSETVSPWNDDGIHGLTMKVDWDDLEKDGTAFKNRNTGENFRKT